MKQISEELISQLVNYIFNTPTGNFNLNQAQTLIAQLRNLKEIDDNFKEKIKEDK